MPVKFKCPECNQDFEVVAETLESCEGATMDCKHCEALLLCVDGKAVEFHGHLHESNPMWPADGKNTYSMDVGSGEIREEGREESRLSGQQIIAEILRRTPHCIELEGGVEIVVEDPDEHKIFVRYPPRNDEVNYTVHLTNR